MEHLRNTKIDEKELKIQHQIYKQKLANLLRLEENGVIHPDEANIVRSKLHKEFSEKKQGYRFPPSFGGRG